MPSRDGLEAELEAAFGSAVVRCGGCVEAGAQPRELSCDLAGFGRVVADQFFRVAAIAAELAGERGRGG